MTYNNGPTIVRNGLVLALDAGNIKSYPGSGTTWNDLSGNNANGTLTNGPTFSNTHGGRIIFDGIDDIVTTPTLSEQFLTTGFSVSVIINYNAQTSNDNVISWGNGSFNAGTSNAWELRLRGSTGAVEFAIGRLVGAESAPRRVSYNPSAVSTTLNGRNVVLDATYIANGIGSIYENGILSATNDYTTAGTSTTTNQFRIGRGTDTNFPGSIYSVKIYNRPLSTNEILQNFNATRGRFGI